MLMSIVFYFILAVFLFFSLFCFDFISNNSESTAGAILFFAIK